MHEMLSVGGDIGAYALEGPDVTFTRRRKHKSDGDDEVLHDRRFTLR